MLRSGFNVDHAKNLFYVTPKDEAADQEQTFPVGRLVSNHPCDPVAKTCDEFSE